MAIDAAAPFPVHVILAAQAWASAAMCGLIWFVQLVHYPLFARVGGERSAEHAAENQRRTSWVVVPFMLVEMAAAIAIAIVPPAGIGRGVAVAGVVLVIVIWASTVLVQMPLHARLGPEGHAPEVVAALVRTNWFRTAAWTVRAALAIWMLHVAG